MTVSVGALSTIVTVATLVATVTPIFLLVLFARDCKRGLLW